MDITVKVEGVEQLQARFRQIPPRFIKRAASGLKQVLLQAQQYTQRNHLRHAGATTLAKRTGSLVASLRSRVDIRGAVVDGEYGSYNSKYAPMHEFGDTVRPTHGKFLTVPLRASLTAGGAPRWTAGELKSNPGAGGFVSTFIVNGIIFGQKAGSSVRGKGMGARQIIPLFVLKKSVRIPARPFLKPTFEKNILPRYSAVLDKLATEAVA